MQKVGNNYYYSKPLNKFNFPNNIDYTDFNNFINYSSAELRTKIAKNKIKDYLLPEIKANDDKNIFKTIRQEVDSAFNIQNKTNENIMMDLLKDIYYRK